MPFFYGLCRFCWLLHWHQNRSKSNLVGENTVTWVLLAPAILCSAYQGSCFSFIIFPFRDIGRVCIEICQIWLILCQKEHCRKCVSRKYPYPPPPPTEDHWKVQGGFMGNCFSRGCEPRTKHWKQRMIDPKHKNIPTGWYVRSFEKKSQYSWPLTRG